MQVPTRQTGVSTQNRQLCVALIVEKNVEIILYTDAYPVQQLRFAWFSNHKIAINKNPDVQLPELFVNAMVPEECNGERFGGCFYFLSCSR